MKTILSVLIISLSINLMACAQEVIDIESPEGVRFNPRTGIPFNEFMIAWAQILPQLPEDHTLLDLTVVSDSEIEIRTCKKDSHSYGAGGSFVFNKLKGTWVKTQTGSWIS